MFYLNQRKYLIKQMLEFIPKENNQFELKLFLCFRKMKRNS